MHNASRSFRHPSKSLNHRKDTEFPAGSSYLVEGPHIMAKFRGWTDMRKCLEFFSIGKKKLLEFR